MPRKRGCYNNRLVPIADVLENADMSSLNKSTCSRPSYMIRHIPTHHIIRWLRCTSPHHRVNHHNLNSMGGMMGCTCDNRAMSVTATVEIMGSGVMQTAWLGYSHQVCR